MAGSGFTSEYDKLKKKFRVQDEHIEHLKLNQGQTKKRLDLEAIAAKGGIKRVDSKLAEDILPGSYRAGFFSRTKKTPLNPTIESAIKEILDLKTPEVNHKIASNVVSANNYHNPVQYASEVLSKIDKKVGHIFAIDTEWVSGGKMGIGSITEVGIQPILMKKGQINSINKEEALTFAVKLDDSEAEKIKKLIEKVKRQGFSYNLSSDEARSLKDLYNYSNKHTNITVEGIVVRNLKESLIDKQNLFAFIDDIEKGFELLDPKNRTSNAIERSMVGVKVTEALKNRGYKLDQNPIFLWHNGYGADIPTIEQSFKKPVSEVFGFGGEAKHFDTMTWLRAFHSNPIDIHSEKSLIKGVLTLEELMSTLGVSYNAHQAGEDAYAGAKLFEWLMNPENRKKASENVKVSRSKFKTGSQLFSRGSIYRSADSSNALDYVVGFKRDGSLDIRNYQSVANYKNARHVLVNQFERTVAVDGGSKKFYGVLLHNIDDNLYSIVARENIRDLQSVIQSNFVHASKAKGAELRNYSLKDKAIREYRGMFSGEKASRNFDRYMKAYEFTVAKGYQTRDGRLTKNAISSLVGEEVLTSSQANKFSLMFDRIHSERQLLTPLHQKLNSLTGVDDSIKDAALMAWKVQVDRRAAHVQDLDLPSSQRFSKIFDPTKRTFEHIDSGSIESLSRGLNKMAVDNVGSVDFNIADAKSRLREIVAYLGHEGVIEDEKVKKLWRNIDKFKGFNDPSQAYRGFSFLANDVAAEIIGNLAAVNTVQGQESLLARPEKLLKPLLRNNKNNKIIEESILVAQRYSVSTDSTTRGSALVEGNVKKAISRIDGYQTKRVAGLSPQIAENIKRHGPTSLAESIERISNIYANKGISSEIYIAEKAKGPGLTMVLWDAQSSKQIMNKGKRNVAEIFIPLIDTKTGLLDFSGVPGVNVLRPRLKSGQVVFDTYQNLAVDVVGYKNVVEEITEAIRTKNYTQAQKIVNRQSRLSIAGMPSASRYVQQELITDLIGSSSTMNNIRNKWIDLKGLAYDVFESSGTDGKRRGFDDLSRTEKKEFMREILYSKDEELKYVGRKNRHRETERIVRELGNLGIDYDVSGLGASKIQAGFINLKSGDPRRLGLFGYYSDPSQEKLRQAQNFYKLNLDDVLFTGVSGSIGGGVTRRQYLDSLTGGDENLKRRYVGRLASTSEYLNLTSKRSKLGKVTDVTAINLKTAFMSDFDIERVLEKNEKDSSLNKLLSKLSTHDDMMVIRSDVAPLLGAVEQKIIHLDKESLPLFENLKEGTVLRYGDSLDDLGAGGRKYDLRYDGVVRGISQNDKGMYDIAVDQIIPAIEGGKSMDIHGGNKFTWSLVSPEELASLGKNYENIESIQKIGTKKLPGGLITSQLQLVMDAFNKQYFDAAITTGKITKANLEGQVYNIIESMLNYKDGDQSRYTDKEIKDLMSKLKRQKTIKISETMVDGIKTNTLSLSSDFKPGNLSTRALFEGVNNLLQQSYNTSNIIDSYNFEGKTVNILQGITSISKSQVSDYAGTVGSNRGLVKLSLRELEFMNHRGALNNTDISRVQSLLEGQIFAGSASVKKEGRQMLMSFQSAAGNPLHKESEIGTIRTRGLAPRAENTIDKLFDQVSLLPSEMRGLTAAETRGTILDPDLFNGRAFFLELPKTVAVGKNNIDRVLMPAMHLQGAGDENWASGMQGQKKRLFEAVSKFRQEGTEANFVNMTRATESYYSSMGKEIMDTKGYIYENALSREVSNSGHFHVRTVSTAKYGEFAETMNQLPEGHALISRKDLRGMLGGVEQAGEIMDIAEKEGFSGLALRYPIKEFTTVNPVKLRVLSEEAEATFNRNLESVLPSVAKLNPGGSIPNALEGNIWFTVGTQTLLEADMDGDMAGVALLQLSGDKVKKVDSLANKQMNNWFDSEVKWAQSMGNRTREAAKVKAIENIDKLGSTLDLQDVIQPGEDIVALIEGRINKDVGVFSNAHTRIRRMTESAITVGKIQKDSMTYAVINAFGSAFEEAPISAKHLSKYLSDVPVEQYGSYLGSTSQLLDSVRAMNVEGMLGAADNLKMFDESGIFIGSPKDEGSRFSTLLKDRLAEGGETQLTRSHIRTALNDLVGAYGGQKSAANAYRDPYLNMALGSFSGENAASESIDFFGNKLISPKMGQTYSHDSLNHLLSHGLDSENLIERTQSASQATFDLHSLDRISSSYRNRPSVEGGVGQAASSLLGAGQATTPLERVASNIEGSSGKLAKIAALTAGGLWAIGSMSRRHDSREYNAALPDQAPSSDGQYVHADPMIFSGAPMGAGPTARISPTGHRRTNININASSMNGMSNEEVANLISEEIGRQTSLNLNLNINSQDDRQKIDRVWLQQQFSNVLKTGYAY